MAKPSLVIGSSMIFANEARMFPRDILLQRLRVKSRRLRLSSSLDFRGCVKNKGETRTKGPALRVIKCICTAVRKLEAIQALIITVEA